MLICIMSLYAKLHLRNAFKAYIFKSSWDLDFLPDLVQFRFITTFTITLVIFFLSVVVALAHSRIHNGTHDTLIGSKIWVPLYIIFVHCTLYMMFVQLRLYSAHWPELWTVPTRACSAVVITTAVLLYIVAVVLLLLRNLHIRCCWTPFWFAVG